MTTTMTSPSSISSCWRVSWTFTSSPSTFFLSDFISVPGKTKEAFRFAAETDAYDRFDKVCCYVNCVELARFGLAVKEVTCMVQEKGTAATPHLRTLVRADGVEGPMAFFVCRSFIAHKYKPPVMTFRLVVSGTAEQYAPYRTDSHLGQQLWTAAVNGQKTDVVFQVGDNTFPAHKFILAARSPVFRAMFNADMAKSRTGEVKIVDVDPDLFEQFLRFLYTGQLAKPLSNQLGMLAEKYQVETLANLCRTVSTDIGTAIEDGYEIGMMLPKNPKHSNEDRKICLKSLHPSLNMNLLHTEVYTARNVIQDFDKTAPIIGDFFQYHVDPDPGYSSGRYYDVKFYSCWGTGPLACRIAAVKMLILTDSSSVPAEHLIMEPFQQYSTGNPIQIFQKRGVHINCCTSDGQPAIPLRFVIDFATTVETFQTQLSDSLFAQELWSSRINKERTEVEFRVGDKTFPAHRALLAARCPALAALVPAQSSPSSPGIVSIPNVDPLVFEEILYFLYTGSVRVTAHVSQHLAEAAVAYKLETLSKIAFTGQKKRANLDQITEFIMSNI